jgi:hypothetical protein
MDVSVSKTLRDAVSQSFTSCPCPRSTKGGPSSTEANSLLTRTDEKIGSFSEEGVANQRSAESPVGAPPGNVSGIQSVFSEL